MGCDSSKNERPKNLENKITYFHNWNDKIGAPINILETEVLTPLSLQDNLELITRKKTKEIILEKFVLEKNNFLKDKNNQKAKKRRLIMKGAKEIQQIYRPERFDFQPSMLHHKNVDIFNKEKLEVPFVELSNKYFFNLEFKVIENEIIPIKIPKYYESVIKQNLCNLSFKEFKSALSSEIELIASKYKKENYYKSELDKINQNNFFEKIIFLFSIESFWYNELNEFLKQTNLEEQVFDINSDDLEIKYNFNSQSDVQEIFKKKKSYHEIKKILNFKNNKNSKAASKHSEKFGSQIDKELQDIDNVIKYNVLADDFEFKEIENAEEIKDLIDRKIIVEEEIRKAEQKPKAEKKEKNKEQKENDSNNQEDESSDEENDFNKFSENKFESEVEREIEEIKNGTIYKNNQNKILTKKKNFKLDQELENIKFSYLAISAAISNFSLDKQNEILNEEEVRNSKINDEKTFETKLYKFQLLKKDEIENIILKQMQIRIHNEFISLYKIKEKAEKYIKAKSEYSEEPLIKVCFQLRIPYYIQNDYFLKSKIFNENEKYENIMNLNKESKKSVISYFSNNESEGKVNSDNKDNNFNKKKTDLNPSNLSANDKKNFEAKRSQSFKKTAAYNTRKLELISEGDENYYLNCLSLINTQKYSFFENEEEILLNSGSVIMIDNVVQITENYYEIKASLINFSFMGFCHFLPGISEIEYLNLSNNALGKKETNAKIFRKVFGRLNKIAELNLAFNSFGENQNNCFGLINKCLLENNTLKVLNLSFNYFGKSKENMSTLAGVLSKSNSQIYEINISNNYLGSDDKIFGLFTDALKSNKLLEIIDLSNNSLATNIKSLMILNEYLTKHSKLIELDLSNNALGEEKKYARMISYAIMGSTSLLKVDLSSNKLGSAAAKSKQNKNSKLNFNLNKNNKADNNNNNSSSISYISEIFIFNEKIQELNLADNNIGLNSTDCEVLFRSMLMNKSIKKIDLSNNHLGPKEENVKYLRNYLIKNQHANELILDENEFFNDNLPILLSGIKKSKSFHSISLLKNQLDRSESFRKLIEKIRLKQDFADIIY